MNDFWVFGYASLMWKPGFRHVERRRATLFGYHRSLCITSVEHRGTPERPGLVMGLDRGGSCVGVAFRVESDDGESVLAYLRERELVTNVYLERHGTIRLETGDHARALIYVADREHGQYAGRLSVDDAVERVCGAVGGMGPNEDYVINTADHVRTLGIRDHWLETVTARIRKQIV
ncbi:gamma-glutamylcyclotransferase [Oricola sp.]|uniref:gamma-glutamylcyclotransferase n=1 Tax=Oricola sp. TaxID=1979950 RepID=UPI003BAB5385